MSQRASNWSVTINNPIAADEENINLARQKGWNVEGQLEKGANGTPHYQLAVRTPQVRFTAVRKAFPRAHVEVARNVTALLKYVHKDETKEGELREQSDKYPSLSKLWDLVANYWLSSSVPPTAADDLLDETLYPSGLYSLTYFDRAIRDLICKGYHVETMGVNPQMRSAWKLYARQLVFRSYVDNVRQTDENAVEVVNIPTDALQEEDDEASGSEGEGT